MFLRKTKSQALKSPSTPHEDELKKAAESLYKQNHELAIKNKTLSLLRELYQTSIQNLEPNILAGKLAEQILKAFEYELVAFFSYNGNRDELVPSEFARSERWNATRAKLQVHIDSFHFPSASTHPILGKVLRDKQMVHIENITELWGKNVSEKTLKEFQENTHLKSILMYPLFTDGKNLGVLMFGLNRNYDELIQYEKDSIGSFINVISIALDKAYLYQELQVTNEDLAVANDKLKELDQLKSEFLGLASHQLRSPMTAIKGYASLILEGEFGTVSPELKGAVDIIYHSTQTLTSMVADFLDVSRIEQGNMKCDMADFDFKVLTEEVISEQKPNIEKAGLAFAFKPEEGKTYMM
ncbi:MAG: GAF domain-containing sensor histidine kinase, partial [Candidatus Pacebacteria bacterium]|nr:GAF domain-containing sensor histidine kinase [Candidatus Paceibacterota bacterium]